MRLRDGTEIEDPRLDCLVDFDEASRGFAVRDLHPAAPLPKSRFWNCDLYLDQGREGACVGAGVTHELAAEPCPVFGLTMDYARRHIYWPAQRLDQWPGGAYPGARPRYEGTSVRAGCRAAQAAGWCDSYYWAFGLDDLIRGIALEGPAILGLTWHEGMGQTDNAGHIHPTGPARGRHCILAKEVDLELGRFKLHNSWGRRWGLRGCCFVGFGDMAVLLHEQGEAAFFIGRHPTPRQEQ